ncbi:LytR C-terminal domain-containing protein [Candidatus Gottesmanbacteria bacterium]|nr:LytR C-terminal domain-containing protein [Candidatus Gottesmanbacteria bacterium]
MITSALAFLAWRQMTIMPSQRITIAIISDVALILSWDDRRGQLTVFTLPADVRIEGVYGVGHYPIGSLRTLEELDPTKTDIVARSIENALGLPIEGALAVSARDGDATQIAMRALSPVNLAQLRRGNIPIPTRIRLWWMLSTLRPDKVVNVDLGGREVYRTETLADGSSVRLLDTNRFDAVVGSSIEVEEIRTEKLRVRVVNTTDTSGVGNRVARMVDLAGMVVVAVDSDGPVQAACTIHAKKIIWSTQSVAFLRSQFGCTLLEEGLDERVDVTVRLGTTYAADFLPTHPPD